MSDAHRAHWHEFFRAQLADRDLFMEAYGERQTLDGSDLFAALRAKRKRENRDLPDDAGTRLGRFADAAGTLGRWALEGSRTEAKERFGFSDDQLDLIEWLHGRGFIPEDSE